MPFLFNEFEEIHGGIIKYLPKPRLEADDACMHFFKLSLEEVYHLFIPGGQNLELYNGKVLTHDAEPEEVGENMFEFINVKLKKH